MAENTCEQPRFFFLWMGFLTLYKYSLMKSLTAVIFHLERWKNMGSQEGFTEDVFLLRAEDVETSKCLSSQRRKAREGGSQPIAKESWVYLRWWFQIFFIFTLTWGKVSNLTNIFQMGWNHQLVYHGISWSKTLNCRQCQCHARMRAVQLARAKWELVCRCVPYQHPAWSTPCHFGSPSGSYWHQNVVVDVVEGEAVGGRSSFSWQSDSRYGTSKYRDMMTRLAQDPVGQTVQFELLMCKRSTKGTTPPPGSPTANFH